MDADMKVLGNFAQTVIIEFDVRIKECLCILAIIFESFEHLFRAEIYNIFISTSSTEDH